MPNVDQDPKGSINGMKMLNKIAELRGLVNETHNVTSRFEESLGECSEGNEYEIVPYDGKFWINHKVVGSGEPLLQWVQSVLNV